MPDQHGNQPMGVPIAEHCATSSPAHTGLDLEALQAKLAEDPSLPPSSLSTDPGRFLCNYVYYKSLGLQPRARALFVHVPNHEHVSAQRLLAFAVALMGAIARLLLESGGGHGGGAAAPGHELQHRMRGSGHRLSVVQKP